MRISGAPVTATLGKVDVVQTYPLEAEEQLVQTLRGCSYARTAEPKCEAIECQRDDGVMRDLRLRHRP